MNREEIVSVLSSWNFWGREIETGRERTLQLSKALDFIKSRANKVVAISGVRRSGKTVLARQIVKRLIDTGHEKNSTLIINFEEPAFAEYLDLKSLLAIYSAYKEVVRPGTQPVIVLDEVQDVSKWEKFVRALQERNEARMIVTGSSSALMSGEFATVLTGRTLEIRMFPLSFGEFLGFSGIEIKERLDAVSKKEDVLKGLEGYLRFGGFPEAAIESSEEVKTAIIRKIYDDILFKDIVKRWSIKNIGKLEVLSAYYQTNFSSQMTFNRIAKFLGLPVKTVELYSKYIELSNLIFFISRHSFSVKEQENSPRKAYSIDTGMANLVSHMPSQSYGRLVENVVALELHKKRHFATGFGVHYWKDYAGREVDFVLSDKGRAVHQLIQACYDISNPDTKERELKALASASRELKCDNLLVITWDREGEEKFDGKKVQYVPLWKWLLGAK